ncbi:DinB family protein [Paenibacillus sp. FSL W7-1279]|uniref:DinB family protein n=1 Tax=Paenibacillus TaxID=44249 RepID=UPI001C7C9EC8|nr:DinB family protein [Paenibacillus lautus]MBX4151946.1 DinB family protein [Paenibacillus lautus]
MAHANDVLMNQLLANANDPSWHIPFQQSVKHLTEDEAFWTPANDSHSIVEIIQHLLYWNETWQTRYRESRVDAVPSIGDNHKSFIIPDNATFAELRDRLLEVLLQWQELLSAAKLEQEVDGFPEPAKWWEIVGNAATHNAYHIGQIAYIRKLQKSCTPLEW